MDIAEIIPEPVWPNPINMMSAHRFATRYDDEINGPQWYMDGLHQMTPEDVEEYGPFERVYTAKEITDAGLVKPGKHVNVEHTLLADVFNGFQIVVSGNPKSLDVLKNLLVKDRTVRSIRIFDNEAGDYVVKLNYTALKELRNG